MFAIPIINTFGPTTCVTEMDFHILNVVALSSNDQQNRQMATNEIEESMAVPLPVSYILFLFSSVFAALQKGQECRTIFFPEYRVKLADFKSMILVFCIDPVIVRVQVCTVAFQISLDKMCKAWYVSAFIEPCVTVVFYGHFATKVHLKGQVLCFFRNFNIGQLHLVVDRHLWTGLH